MGEFIAVAIEILLTYYAFRFVLFLYKFNTSNNEIVIDDTIENRIKKQSNNTIKNDLKLSEIKNLRELVKKRVIS
jgi:hypothetical protein